MVRGEALGVQGKQGALWCAEKRWGRKESRVLFGARRSAQGATGAARKVGGIMLHAEPLGPHNLQGAQQHAQSPSCITIWKVLKSTRRAIIKPQLRRKW